MSNPLVSIIIPTFNSEKYLKECLDSAVNQTLKNIEIIVVDSASKDKTIQIVEEYAKLDNRIRLIKRGKEWVGISRNYALDKASGNYIMFLDSDDILGLNACEVCYAKIEKDSSDFVLFGNYQNGNKVYNKHIEICKKIEDNVVNPAEIAELISALSVEPWKKIYSREFLNKNNIRFSELSFGEDVIFSWKTTLLAKRFSVINKFLYDYRLINNGVGCSSITSRYKDNLKAFYEVEQFLLNIDNSSIFINPFIKEWVNNLFYWIDKINLKERYEYLKDIRDIFVYLNNKYSLALIFDSDRFGEIYKFIHNFDLHKPVVKSNWLITVEDFPFCTHKIYSIFGIKIKRRK